MKSYPIRNLFVLVLTFSLIPVSFAQSLFLHTSTSANTQTHITTLNHASTNGKPNAIVIVNQRYNGVYNSNEVGVYYAQGKWKIFNQNRAKMPMKTQFNVMVIDPSRYKKAFVHTTTAQNTQGHITTLNAVLSNNQANAKVIFTQRYGKYNNNPMGVWFSGGKWKLFNENRKPIPIGTKFNVWVINGISNGKIMGMKAHAFSQRASAATKKKFASKHVNYLSHIGTNNQANSFVFYSQNWKGVYNPNTSGVWYDKPNWTIFNQNRKAIPDKVQFEIVTLAKGPNSLAVQPQITKPVYTQVKPSVVSQGTINKNPINKAFTSKNYNLGKMVVLPYATPANTEEGNSEETGEEISTEIQGPNLLLSRDINVLLGDAQMEYFVEKLNINREVYEDINPNSGFMYYLPSAYSLKWSGETGVYSFFIYYLSADDEGRGDVIITAELTPDVSASDIAIAEKILSKKLEKEIKLRPMPLRNTPGVSFGNMLSNFDVDENTLSTNIPSDFLEPIVVSWRMGQRVDDLLGAMMNNLGIVGNMTFEPFSETEKNISVPIKLKVNDIGTYGHLEFRSASKLLNGYYNQMDYPVVLKELVLLREPSAGNFAVETVSMANYEVGPKKLFSDFSANERNAVLEGDLLNKMWMIYDIKPCSNCNTEVQQKILGGTSDSRVKEIELEILTPLAASGAQMIKLLIKSKQGDPNGENEVILPMLTITSDNQSLRSGELFIGEGEAIDYEYQLVMVMPDGQVRLSEWTEGTEMFLVIGTNTIQTLFPEPEVSEE